MKIFQWFDSTVFLVNHTSRSFSTAGPPSLHITAIAKTTNKNATHRDADGV